MEAPLGYADTALHQTQLTDALKGDECSLRSWLRVRAH